MSKCIKLKADGKTIALALVPDDTFEVMGSHIITNVKAIKFAPFNKPLKVDGLSMEALSIEYVVPYHIGKGDTANFQPMSITLSLGT